MEGSKPRTVEASKTGLELIETVAALGTPRFTNIVKKAKKPKSTVHKHLQTLIHCGYIEHVDGRYYLSPRFIQFGNLAADQWEIDQYASIIDDLSEVAHEAAGVYIEQGGSGITLYQTHRDPEQSEQDAIEMTDLLHACAAGKSLLATYTDDELDRYLFENDLRTLTENTIDTKSELRTEIDRIRERGIAFERGEQIEDINGIATTVSSPELPFNIAMYILGSSSRISGKRLEQDLSGNLIEYANRIEKVLRSSCSMN